MAFIALSEERGTSPCGRHLNVYADMQRKDRNSVCNEGELDVGLSPKAPSRPEKSHAQSKLLQPTTPVAYAGTASMTSAAPKLAPSSHIHRLAEPVSTRKRSRKEDIILLKASVVNGFKCPPWDKNPAPSDFTPQHGQELFMYAKWFAYHVQRALMSCVATHTILACRHISNSSSKDGPAPLTLSHLLPSIQITEMALGL